MGAARYDGECVGVVFGLEWGLSDWECDGADRSEFGLQPRDPQGAVGAAAPGTRARPAEVAAEQETDEGVW